MSTANGKNNIELYDHSSDSLYKFDPLLLKKINPQVLIWIPVVESAAFNFVLGGFNHFVMNSEFAKISWGSIGNNFHTGFAWDADALSTNMFAHPFQGSMYYNFARTAGYDYWVSMGVAAFGSLHWEFFMETEPPAINDFVMTTLGGAMYGELFYRFSNLIIDERVAGAERTFREVGAGFFNPARLINRLIYGRAGRNMDEQIYERNPNFGDVSIGINNVADGTFFKDGEKNLVLALKYTYGHPFYKRRFKPFDFFRFYTLINFWNQPLLGQFRIYGILYGKRYSLGGDHRLVLGFFQHSDYLKNNVYEIGGVSVGAGVGYRTPRNQPYSFAGMLHIAAMPMGAANSDYAPHYSVAGLDSARTYNMGVGAQAKLDAVWRFPIGELSFSYSFWWVHTLNGAPGDELIGMLWPSLSFNVYQQISIGLELLFYQRNGLYDDFPNIYLRNNEKRAFVSFRL